MSNQSNEITTLEAEVTRLAKEVARLTIECNELRKFVELIANNFDCDEDGHKYGTYCRTCDAVELLNRLECEGNNV